MQVKQAIYVGVAGSALVFSAAAAISALTASNRSETRNEPAPVSQAAPAPSKPDKQYTTLVVGGAQERRAEVTADTPERPETVEPGIHAQSIDLDEQDSAHAEAPDTETDLGTGFFDSDLSDTDPRPYDPLDDGQSSGAGGLVILNGSTGGGGGGGSGGSGITGGSSGGGGGGSAGGGASPGQPSQPTDTAPSSPAPTPTSIPGLPRNRVLAFPGAKGYGAYASGGRGGDVYFVTNLDNDGPGSLRDGLESMTGPRTIIFRTGGTIYLDTPLRVRHDNLTIAGQTAPGDGITIAGQPFSIISTNVIVRHLRIRVGDINAMDREASNEYEVPLKPGRGLKNVHGDGADTLSIAEASRVIIDHVSLSWSMDETLSVTRSSNVTVQNCLIAESLNDSYHPKGEHGFGALIVGASGIDSGITLAQNLYMHHYNRCPGASVYLPGYDTTGRLRLDFSNNIVYNWKRKATHVIEQNHGGLLEFNLGGNIYIPGNNTHALDHATFENLVEETVYGRNNYMTDDDGERYPAFSRHPLSQIDLITDRPPFPAVDNYFPEQLETWVSTYVGAFLKRDAVDTRLLDDFENRNGTIIDSQDDVGGFPTLSAGTAEADSDGDGMPDAWEIDNQLDPGDPQDRNHLSPTGWTMLETYLNSLIEYETNLDTMLFQQD